MGTVSIIGAPEREIQVYCDPHKLQAYNITIETIAAIIGQENKNTPGGTVDIGSNTYSVRVQKEFTNANEMLMKLRLLQQKLRLLQEKQKMLLMLLRLLQMQIQLL